MRRCDDAPPSIQMRGLRFLVAGLLPRPKRERFPSLRVCLRSDVTTPPLPRSKRELERIFTNATTPPFPPKHEVETLLQASDVHSFSLQVEMEIPLAPTQRHRTSPCSKHESVRALHSD
jgi:hypothetical protein